MNPPAQAVGIDLKCLIFICLKQEQEQGGSWSPGQLLGSQIFLARSVCVPSFAPGWTRAHCRNSALGGAGHRGGADLALQMERNAGRNKNHLKMKAEAEVRNTGGAERVCTI